MQIPTLLALALLLPLISLARPYAYQVTASTTISVFNLKSLRETGAIGIPGGAETILPSADGKDIYAAVRCGLFVARTSTNRVTVSNNSLCDTAVARSPTSGLLYGLNGNTVDVIDPVTLAAIGHIPLPVIQLNHDGASIAVSMDGLTLFALIQYSPNGPQYAARSSWNAILVVDLQTNKVKSAILTGFGAVMRMSPDGTRLFYVVESYTGVAYAGVVRELDTATLSNVATFDIFPSDIAISPDNSKLCALVGSELDTIATSTGQVIGRVPITGYLSHVAISPTEPVAYVSVSTSPDVPGVRIIDLDTQTIVDSIRLVQDAYSLALSPDGFTLYVGLGLPTAINVLDTATHASVGTIECTGIPRFAAISADASRLFALCDTATPSGHQLVRANALTFERLKTIAISDSPFYLALSPDGNTIFVAVQSGSSSKVHAFDAQTLQPGLTYQVAAFDNHGSETSLMSVSPDNAYLYVYTVSGLVKVDIGSGAIVAVAKLEINPVGPITLAPAGDLVYLSAALSNGGYIVSRVRTSDMSVLAPLPFGGLYQVLSSDGKEIYIADTQSGVIKGDTTTGKIVGVYSVPNELGFMALTPDSSKLFITGYLYGDFVIDTQTGAQTQFNTLPGTQIVIAP